MEAAHFDSLTTRLTDLRSRRGLLAGVLVTALGLSAGDETEVKAKLARKGWVCACSGPEVATCASQKLSRKKVKTLLRANSCAYQGRCTGVSGCAAGTGPPPGPPPPPACVPEPVTTTCAAGCGARLNTCNQTVTCPCPSGQTCLPNGTCARPCTGTASCTGCSSTACSIASSEGPSFCILPGGACSTLQRCDPANTTGCPQGFVCLAPCGLDGARCAAVAVCPAV